MPQENPRVTLITCMKNEGPFILEWIAWHRSIGVTDFVVFTNDCTDGTDKLLDELDSAGYVQHLPNPALVAKSTQFQPIAIKYAHELEAVRNADYVISMDVDEFFEIKIGNGHLVDLFDASGEFDVISVSETNHGANQIEEFEDNWVTSQFLQHQNLTPGKWRSRRGVKSITRNSNRIPRIRNHRPDARRFKDIRWLDGSLRQTTHFIEDASENGHDCRGSYDAITMHHYPLRSLNSYLVKIDRGDVVANARTYGETYWKRRNLHEGQTDLSAHISRAQTELAKMYSKNENLNAAHEVCVAAHNNKIEDLKAREDYLEKVDRLKQESW